jgi:mannosyl-oligosaccharide glucosidase
MNLKSYKLFLLASLLAISFAFDWTPRFPTSTIDDITHWGTYKSQRIHSITEISAPLDSLTLSLLLANDLSDKNINNLKYNMKDIQSFSEDQSQIYYKYHNGFYYAEQVIEDHNTNINMTNTFYKIAAKPDLHRWNSLSTVNKYEGSSQDYITMFYAIAIENYNNNGTRYLELDPTISQIKVMDSAHKDSPVGTSPVGYINYFIYQNGKVDPSGVEVFYQSFAGLNQSELWKVPDVTIDALNFGTGGDANYLTLANSVAKDTEATQFVLVQFKVPVNADVSVLFSYDSAYPVSAPNWLATQALLKTFESEYLAAFDVIFPNIDASHKELARYALSNLLGGIIYYYGPLQITEDPSPQPALPLFTATPTRNSFQRGFLWDEGFHELLICNWSPDLCTKIIGYWLGTQYYTGWIAREQVRGEESASFVPGGFVSQSNREGNPPTLMLALDYFLANPKVDKSLKQLVYTKYKDPLYNWWSWFYHSQQVNDTNGTGTNMFIWSYKDLGDHIQYFGSGLDDYPRDDPGYISKNHLDLHVWEILFADVMHQISVGAGDTANATFFGDLSQTLISKLPLFLDPADNIYKDIFKPNNTDDSNTIDVPSSHVGYVSLLPLCFGHVKDNSAEFNATLDLVDYQLPGLTWSDYGIISLAKNDSKFEQNQNYWTGPIWINFNYMLLRAFKLYYWENPRVQDLYTHIREAILGTMTNSFENT